MPPPTVSVNLRARFSVADRAAFLLSAFVVPDGRMTASVSLYVGENWLEDGHSSRGGRAVEDSDAILVAVLGTS